MKQKKNITEILIPVLIVFLTATVMIMLCRVSVFKAYSMFIYGIIGNKTGFFEIFVKATPLILTGLGCAVAFKSGFFNIGAEGQFYIGALSSTIVALGFPGLPGIVRIILAFFAGFIGGGLWSFLAAIFKEKFRISEIIVTIMLNYIAINFVGIAVRSFLMDPAGSIPQSAKISQDTVLPLLMPPSRLNTGFFVAVAAVIVVWVIMDKTTIGYEIKAVGYNKRAAYCNGISNLKSIVTAAFLSGGLAGMAGVIEVIGIQKKLLEGISSDCGYTAVLIALLASNHPIGVLLAAVGFATLQVGANTMQRQMGIPFAIVNTIMGLSVLLILAKELFRRRDVTKSAER